MNQQIELVLFTTETEMVLQADKAGINHFMVDLEQSDLDSRKALTGKETEVNKVEDILSLSKITNKPIWCRINAYGEHSKQEVQSVIENGVDVILLPMVKTIEEVKEFLILINGQAKTGILVETKEACDLANQLSKLPLDYIYVGLFDLSLSRNSNDIFEPLYDGTVEILRNIFNKQKFGVAGLTTIDSGKPIPGLQLMNHIARLGCDFTFLRNSFKKDIQGKCFNQEILSIRQAWDHFTNAD
jgi:citrate lyase beta subunit